MNLQRLLTQLCSSLKLFSLLAVWFYCTQTDFRLNAFINSNSKQKHEMFSIKTKLDWHPPHFAVTLIEEEHLTPSSIYG